MKQNLNIFDLSLLSPLNDRHPPQQGFTAELLGSGFTV
jgi:hypothetical protein